MSEWESRPILQKTKRVVPYNIYLHEKWRDIAFIYPLDRKFSYRDSEKAVEYLEEIGLSKDDFIGILKDGSIKIKKSSALEELIS